MPMVQCPDDEWINPAHVARVSLHKASTMNGRVVVPLWEVQCTFAAESDWTYVADFPTEKAARTFIAKLACA